MSQPQSRMFCLTLFNLGWMLRKIVWIATTLAPTMMLPSTPLGTEGIAGLSRYLDRDLLLLLITMSCDHVNSISFDCAW
jgi:hypothetical protein